MSNKALEQLVGRVMASLAPPEDKRALKRRAKKLQAKLDARRRAAANDAKRKRRRAQRLD
jgi:hypothetical protein